jgi:hypothetical protein
VDIGQPAVSFSFCSAFTRFGLCSLYDYLCLEQLWFMSNKCYSIQNRLINCNVGIYFLLETKKDNCYDSFIRNMWNVVSVK